MLPYTYHIHTSFSCDCDSSMEEMCQTALKAGVAEIGFSDHFDLHAGDPCRGYLRPDAWWQAFRHCREVFEPQGLTLKAGVEVGEPHIFRAEVDDLLERYEWDFVLGSLHWVGADTIFDRDFFHRHPPQEVYRLYFEEIATMCQVGQFDILAHLDVVKRIGYEAYGCYDVREWEAYVRPVLEYCADRGIALEVNTATLRRSVKETTPTRSVLCWYREMGGQYMTIGSDAHHPRDVVAGLDKAIEEVRSAGFTQLTRFTGRRASWVEI